MKSKLAVLMAERGLKIADLYRDTGISKTTLMQIANNTGKGIQYRTLEKLLDYFDVPIDCLLDVENEEQKNCVYCRNNKAIKLDKGKPSIMVAVINDGLAISTKDSLEILKLSYCPFCGRKL